MRRASSCYEAVTYTTCRECGGEKRVPKPPPPLWTNAKGQARTISSMDDHYLLAALHLCERLQLDGDFRRVVEYRNLVSEAIERKLVSR